MRRPSLALFGLLLASAASEAWTPLPPPPQGRVSGISGNGRRILAANSAGGASWREPGGEWTRSLEAPGWSARMEGGIEVRTLDAVRALDFREEVVLYARPGDTAWNSAWMGGQVDFVSVASDGRRLVAVSRSLTGGRQVMLETDSVVIPTVEGAAGAKDRRIRRAWKRLVRREGGVDFLSGAVHAWISGDALLVLSGTSIWRSPDLGGTWLETDLPPFADVAVRGDTIVARTGDGSGRLHVSLDAGATWNTTSVVDRDGPWELRIAGGMLWARFQQEVARSANLGRSWTTFRNLSASGGVAWDGASFWAVDRGAPVRWDGVGGWTREDVPESRIRKVRAFRGNLLALQGVGDPSTQGWESKRLVAWKDGRWRALRDSVYDIEVAGGSGDAPGRVAVLSGSGSGISHVLSLSTSADLETWTVDGRLKPYVGLLGVSEGDLLVGGADSVFRLGQGGAIRGLAAWSQSEAPLVARFHASGGRALWVVERAQLTTPAGGGIWEGQRVRDWIPDSSGAGGFLVSEEATGRVSFEVSCDWTRLDSLPALCRTEGWVLRSPCGGGEGWSPVVGASRTGGVVHAWNGSDSVMRDEAGAFSVVRAPEGISVVLADRLDASLFDPDAAAGETRLVVADAHGTLWVEGDLPASVAPRAGARSMTVSVHNGTLRFALPAAGRTKVAVFDARGRAAKALLERVLDAGVHEVPTGGIREGIAVVELEGRIVGRVVLLPAR